MHKGEDNMANQVSALNDIFGIEDVLHFRDAGSGFIIADIKNHLANASIALQGAHLMTWAPEDAQPVIWMSPVAKFASGKSIRGGVPICWPWFGPHATESSFPGHGFARTVPWEIISTESAGDGSTHIAFRIFDSEAGSAQWPQPTEAEMRMRIGKSLELELITRNTGTSVITIGDALHTYFAVGDVRKTTVLGLDGCDYLDKVDGGKRKRQDGAVTIDSEVDRIYFDQGQDCVIDDDAMGRRIRIEKRCSHSTIVWNPWVEKCVKMGDFGSDDGYLGMICVESANAADDVVTIAPGESHALWVRYSVENC